MDRRKKIVTRRGLHEREHDSRASVVGLRTTPFAVCSDYQVESVLVELYRDEGSLRVSGDWYSRKDLNDRFRIKVSDSHVFLLDRNGADHFVLVNGASQCGSDTDAG